MKKIFTLFILLFTNLITFSKDDLKDFSIVLDWYPNATHTALYVAKENGYFKDEGINLIINYPANVSDGLILPATKKVNLGISYLHTLIQAKANEKIPVVSVGYLTNRSLNNILSLKEKNVKRPKDLEGKTIGYTGNVFSETILQTMLETDGADTNKVKVVDVGFDFLTAMISKRVDATIDSVYNHEAQVLQDKGYELNHFFPDEYGVPTYAEYILVANKEMIKDNKELYNSFAKALKKGYEYTKNNPDKAIEILISNQEKEQFPLKENIEKKSLSLLLPLMENENYKFLEQDRNLWKKNIEWLYNKGLIKENLNVEDVVVDI